VTITIDGSDVTVKGPKGELKQTFNPDITVKEEDGEIVLTRPTDQRHHRSLHGLSRALLNNMVVGVSDRFERKLTIEGVGYRAEVEGKDLILHVGYSHEVRIAPPDHLSFDVPQESRGREIIISGINKQVVGEMAAYVRKQRPPEPYKGKGIRYEGEYVRMKAGKAGKA
jgi:large subunit ribosomal protein L6